MQKYNLLIIYLKEILLIMSNKFKQYYNNSNYKILKIRIVPKFQTNSLTLLTII